MFLKKLNLLNFKNYESEEFSFSSDVNCLSGNNGSGKTNVLDAIYYLSFCKSYFNSKDKLNVRHGEDYFVVKGQYEVEGETDELLCTVKEQKKKIFKRNQKPYTKLAEHIGKYPSVIITPNDTDLIKEGSAERRKMMDGIISQYNREYLYKLIDYNKVLNQRNNLLKHFKFEQRFDADSLEIWDVKLVELGQFIFEIRNDFIENFTPIFNDYYSRISGGAEKVEISYKSDFHSEDDIFSQLKGVLAKDRMILRTSVGIHKDDLEFLIHDHSLKYTGSQGQQKTFLIALKLAQFQFIKEATGKTPLLLLDDVFDKIDDERIAFMMQLVSENAFGQIFITDTHKGRVSELFRGINREVKEFAIEHAKSQLING